MISRRILTGPILNNKFMFTMRILKKLKKMSKYSKMRYETIFTLRATSLKRISWSKMIILRV